MNVPKIFDRPSDGSALCATCRSAMRVKGSRLGDDRTICRAGLGVMAIHVVECSAYDDERLTAVWELERTAWVLMEVKTKKRFVSPAERARLDD